MAEGKEQTLASNTLHPEAQGTVKGIFDVWQKQMLYDLQVCMPAIFLGYKNDDRETGMGIIKPLVKMVDTDGETYERGEIELPIRQFQHGTFVIDAPLVEGDTGWIVAGDRDNTNVLVNNGAIQGVDSGIGKKGDEGVPVGNQGSQAPGFLDSHKYIYGFFLPDKWGGVPLPEEFKDSLVIGQVSAPESPDAAAPSYGRFVLDPDGTIHVLSARHYDEKAQKLRGGAVYIDLSLDKDAKPVRPDSDKIEEILGHLGITAVAEVQGELNVKQWYDPDGKPHGGNLSVEKDAKVGGTLTVENGATISNGLSVDGDSTINGNVLIKDNTSRTVSIKPSDLKLGGNAHFREQIILTGEDKNRSHGGKIYLSRMRAYVLANEETPLEPVEISGVGGGGSEKGDTGWTGWTGYTGWTGWTGYTGWTGRDGTPGGKGDTGWTGWTGPEGKMPDIDTDPVATRVVWNTADGKHQLEYYEGTINLKTGVVTENPAPILIVPADACSCTGGGGGGEKGDTGWTGYTGWTGRDGTGWTGWTGRDGTGWTGWTGRDGTGWTGWTGKGTKGDTGWTGWTGPRGFNNPLWVDDNPTSSAGTAVTDVSYNGTAGATLYLSGLVTKGTGQVITGSKRFTASVIVGTESSTRTQVGTGYIELYRTGDTGSQKMPFIDFHYDGSTADFTSRIIESAQGVIVLTSPNHARLSVAPITNSSTSGYNALQIDTVGAANARFQQKLSGTVNFIGDMRWNTTTHTLQKRVDSLNIATGAVTQGSWSDITNGGTTPISSIIPQSS